MTSRIHEEMMEYATSEYIQLTRKVDSVELSLDNELIKAAHDQSMETYKKDKPYCMNNKKHGAASSSSSSSLSRVVSIFAFKGTSEMDEWYCDDHFGETYVDKDLFPSLRRIGVDLLAKVNRAFLQRFEHLLRDSGFRLDVEKAVMDHQEILFTGHSSGSAIASFATLWMLDEYPGKQGMKFPMGCVTFGSPLIGDNTLSHAVQRERWAGHFTHFVMQHDIVPRIMLAPKASIKHHLPSMHKFFKEKVNPTPKKSHSFLNFKRRKTQPKTIDHYQLIDADQAVALFENVMINASTVASHKALILMEHERSVEEMLSAEYVKVSPYRPFGNYVFCTSDKVQGSITPRQQLVVENSNSILQLLFYFLQIPNDDQDLVEFAVNSLAENLSYEEELNKNGMQLQNKVYLKDLSEHLLMSGDATYDVVHTRNKALFELTASAKLCLKAVEVAEKRKKENEELVRSLMRKYQIIEDTLDEIREYKETNKDYYEAFKLQKKTEDFLANVRRMELAGIYDMIIEMVMRKDLPDEFEAWEELVDQATLFRRLTEPLDIANYYRHMKDIYSYMDLRPKRYKFAQRWYEHANAMRFGLISESNFIAVVEELKKKIEDRDMRFKKKVEGRDVTLDEVNEEVEKIKRLVLKWKSDKRIPNEDVYWGESSLSMLHGKPPIR